MAKAHERKSARILAFILALIMVASALVYAFRNPSKPEEREIKFDMGKDWSDWIRYLPNNTGYIVYFNYTEKNETLKKFIYNRTLDSINPYVFRDFRPTINYFRSLLIFDYYNYLIDLNYSKVYFAYKQKDVYKNYTLKTGVAAGRLYTAVDETHPVILAYPSYAKAVIDTITGNLTSFTEDYGNYTSRINGSFSYAFILAGDTAKQVIMDNGTPIADFYFEGYRMNGSVYEKVVGIHFLKYYFFVKTNKTVNETAYYYYENYDDGFSIAVMGSYNFTNLTQLMPEMRTVIIKFGNETG
ncbi:hypothetical protein [Archaeoglobus profundus]|uniref:Uncharacterized protein n=1 Tax=Archaeoglobus profundus (strain DSM 5631 / JCM 9629 / NBRC 100127 / Av18) TaxID=572546 RepID=D2RDG7_ARCPA|nr:hypothetical protein [Archaeoglobus profundus]ADB58161.1 hypothetical protein Arcpr_1102 [Archaeoglobus profundus DSM 5631]